MNITRTFIPLLGMGSVLLFSGCAQVTVTANTLVDGTARIADATTNAVNGTFDFTTDVSRSADARTHSARLAFVQSEQELLKRETAAGNGERLKALAYMMHAEDDQAFARLMQGHFEEIFAPESSSEQVLAQLYKVAGTPPDMQQG